MTFLRSRRMDCKLQRKKVSMRLGSAVTMILTGYAQGLHIDQFWRETIRAEY